MIAEHPIAKERGIEHNFYADCDEHDGSPQWAFLLPNGDIDMQRQDDYASFQDACANIQHYWNTVVEEERYQDGEQNAEFPAGEIVALNPPQ